MMQCVAEKMNLAVDPQWLTSKPTELQGRSCVVGSVTVYLQYNEAEKAGAAEGHSNTPERGLHKVTEFSVCKNAAKRHHSWRTFSALLLLLRQPGRFSLLASF
jgi:hypothetical protein